MGAFSGRAGYSGRRVQESNRDDVRASNSAGALVCRRRARPKSAPSRSRRRPPGEVRVRARRERAQPRDRAADLCGACSGERVRAHARAIHERGVSFSRQIWLRDGGRASRRARPSCKAAFASRFIRTRPCLTFRPKISCRCPMACRRSAPCSPPTWRRRSTPSGTARRARPTASRWSARACSGCWSRGFAPKCRGAQVTVVDIDAGAGRDRAQRSAPTSPRPTRRRRDCDLVVHTSASAAGLATALRLAGDEATVLELSWYGANDVHVPLGGVFHSRRLKLISSQVGKVAPSHRPRWDYRRRLNAALDLLQRSRARCADRAAGRVRRSARASCPTSSTRRAACCASSSAIPTEKEHPCTPSKFPTTS